MKYNPNVDLKLNKFYVAESVEFMKANMPDNFVDLTITSPPYDNLRNYKGFTFDYKAMLNELYRVTKDGGVVVWVVGDKTEKGSETLTSYKQALYAKEIGFNVHDTMIYEKQNPQPQVKTKRYTQSFEYMFVFSKKAPNKCNYIMEKCKDAGRILNNTNRLENGETIGFISNGKKVNKTKIKKNIWVYDAGYNRTTKDKIAFKHPAIFPDQLAEDHIISWSNKGDIIFDPMCGSGTVAKMAYLNNRNFICVDMSEEYINDICIPRLKEYGWKEF